MRASRFGWGQRLAAGFAFATLCATVGVTTYPTQRGEVMTTARVEHIVVSNNAAGPQFAPLVSYRDARGAVHTAALAASDTVPYAPGESLTVSYRRDEPTVCRAQSLLRRVAGPTAIAVLAIVGFWRLVRRPI